MPAKLHTQQDFIAPYCEEAVAILYQDQDILLVNKPSGLLSVPGRHPANKDCVISRVQENYSDARIVHRLDMDTSGIMVLARNADSHRQLSRQFEHREITKQYIADVYGELQHDSGSVDLPIMTDWPNRPLQKIDHQHGKKALTHYQVLERNTELHSSRLLLKPVTGRSHQLRIHLAEIGHPILGCDFYAHEQALAMSPRLLLHAQQLCFKHPVSDEQIVGDCPSPF